VGFDPALCSEGSGENAIRALRGRKIDRVVILSCSPRLYLEKFQDMAQEAGMNRYMVEMVNLREQVAWIHENKEEATAKARDLLKMAVARAAYMKPSRHGPVAVVDVDQCSGCAICPSVCRGGSISMVDVGGGKKRARVDDVECKGCGACVAACPSGALNMEGYSNEEVVAEIDVLTEGLEESKEPFPAVVVFACNWCGYAAADLAGLRRLQMDPHFRLIRTPCSARVDPEWIMRSLSRGADGVMIIGGRVGSCHYEGGNLKTRNRMLLLAKLLEQYGYDAGRFAVEWVDPGEAERFRDAVNNFIEKIRELGPNPVRAPAPEERLTSALYHPEYAHPSYER